MVSSCWAPGCTNRWKGGPNEIKLYRFPLGDPERLSKWLKAINRVCAPHQTTTRPDGFLEPTHYSRLCSAHFVSGSPSQLYTNVDYLPTIFKHLPPKQPKSLKRKRERSSRLQDFVYVGNRGLSDGFPTYVPPEISPQSSMETPKIEKRGAYKQAQKVLGPTNIDDPRLPDAYRELHIKPEIDADTSHDESCQYDPSKQIKTEVSEIETDSSPESYIYDQSKRIKTELDSDLRPGESCQPYPCDMETDDSMLPLLVTHQQSTQDPNCDSVTSEMSSAMTSSEHEMPTHQPNGLASTHEKSLPCPYFASVCDRVKQKQVQDLQAALRTEKQLRTMIDYLDSIANINLDLLRKGLHTKKNSPVEAEFKKVYRLVQTIMNAQMWEIKAKLRAKHTHCDTPSKTFDANHQVHRVSNSTNVQNSSSSNNNDSNSNHQEHVASNSTKLLSSLLSSIKNDNKSHQENATSNSTSPHSSNNNNNNNSSSKEPPNVNMNKVTVIRVTKLPPGLSFIKDSLVYNLSIENNTQLLDSNIMAKIKADSNALIDVKTDSDSNTTSAIGDNSSLLSDSACGASSQVHDTPNTSKNAGTISPINIGASSSTTTPSSSSIDANAALQQNENAIAISSPVTNTKSSIDSDTVLPLNINTTSPVIFDTSSQVDASPITPKQNNAIVTSSPAIQPIPSTCSSAPNASIDDSESLNADDHLSLSEPNPEEKPFGCTKCGKGFGSISCLNSHLHRCLSDKQPYQCEQCGESFESNENLINHKLVHNITEKVYACSDCDTKSMRLDSFKSHMKSKHPFTSLSPTLMETAAVS